MLMLLRMGYEMSVSDKDSGYESDVTEVISEQQWTSLLYKARRIRVRNEDIALDGVAAEWVFFLRVGLAMSDEEIYEVGLRQGWFAECSDRDRLFWRMVFFMVRDIVIVERGFFPGLNYEGATDRWTSDCSNIVGMLKGERLLDRVM